MKCNAHICCLYFITSNPGILHDFKAKSTTTEATRQLEGNPKEPEVKKPWVQLPEQEKTIGEEEKTQAT
jgi:hypothetical protein